LYKEIYLTNIKVRKNCHYNYTVRIERCLSNRRHDVSYLVICCIVMSFVISSFVLGSNSAKYIVDKSQGNKIVLSVT